MVAIYAPLALSATYWSFVKVSVGRRLIFLICSGCVMLIVLSDWVMTNPLNPREWSIVSFSCGLAMNLAFCSSSSSFIMNSLVAEMSVSSVCIPMMAVACLYNSSQGTNVEGIILRFVRRWSWLVL